MNAILLCDTEPPLYGVELAQGRPCIDLRGLVLCFKMAATDFVEVRLWEKAAKIGFYDK